MGLKRKGGDSQAAARRAKRLKVESEETEGGEHHSLCGRKRHLSKLRRRESAKTL
jgi:hypothetical protein